MSRITLLLCHINKQESSPLALEVYSLDAMKLQKFNKLKQPEAKNTTMFAVHNQTPVIREAH